MDNARAFDGSRMEEGDQVRPAADGDRERAGASVAGPTRSDEWPHTGPDGSGVDRGGCPSNTHPQNSQKTLEGFPEYTYAGDYDWLEWSIAAEWHFLCFAEMVRDFEALKLECQENREADRMIDLVGVGPVRVCRTGVTRGGAKGQHYEFMIVYRGINIGIANRQIGERKKPNLFARMTGRDCLLQGARQGYEIVREFLDAIGAKVLDEMISRVDLTLDVAGLDVRLLQEIVEQKHFITVSKKVRPERNLVGDRGTGWSAGASPLHMTVYDKAFEQRVKTDALYLQALCDRRWYGQIPEHSTRVEFQLRRGWLTKQGVSSPRDVFQSSGTLARLLCRDWFRLTDGPVDRQNNNQKRAATLPIWKSIEKAFSDVYGQENVELIPLDRERVAPMRLVKQARGCLTKAVLQTGWKCRTLDEFMARCCELLRLTFGSPADVKQFLEMLRREAWEYLSDEAA